jgi:hypothetical protein
MELAAPEPDPASGRRVTGLSRELLSRDACAASGLADAVSWSTTEDGPGTGEIRAPEQKILFLPSAL